MTYVYIYFDIPKGTALNRNDVLYDIKENLFSKFSTNFLLEHPMVFVCSSSKQTENDQELSKHRKEYRIDDIRDGYFKGIENLASFDINGK